MGLYSVTRSGWCGSEMNAGTVDKVCDYMGDGRFTTPSLQREGVLTGISAALTHPAAGGDCTVKVRRFGGDFAQMVIHPGEQFKQVSFHLGDYLTGQHASLGVTFSTDGNWTSDAAQLSVEYEITYNICDDCGKHKKHDGVDWYCDDCYDF